MEVRGTYAKAVIAEDQAPKSGFVHPCWVFPKPCPMPLVSSTEGRLSCVDISRRTRLWTSDSRLAAWNKVDATPKALAWA